MEIQMKKITKSIITMITMILFTILITFTIYEIQIKPNKIQKDMAKINYYQKAYSNILKEMDEYIINIDLKEDILKYYTIEQAKEDINKILNHETITNYDKITEIVKRHTSEDEIIESYSKEINNKITNNLFMIDEYNLLNKTNLKTNDTIFIIFIIIIVIVINFFLNYILTKDISFIITSILSSSFMIMIPKLFLFLTNILKDFMYTNTYFSELLLYIINQSVNLLFAIGLFISILIIYLKKKIK